MAQFDFATKQDLEKMKEEILLALIPLQSKLNEIPAFLNSNDVKKLLQCKDSKLKYLRDTGKIRYIRYLFVPQGTVFRSIVCLTKPNLSSGIIIIIIVFVSNFTMIPDDEFEFPCYLNYFCRFLVPAHLSDPKGDHTT